MKQLITGGTCAAAVLATSMVVFAQATQTPSQPAPGPAAQAAAQEATPAQQTIVGCVQRESDYRRAKSAGAGGAAGTGAGVANEFVLVNAQMQPAGAAAAAGAANPNEAVGTSGAAGEAFELTGSGEGQLESFVGKRVEIVGKMKASTGASDRSTGVSAGGAASTAGSTSAPAGSATGSAAGRTTGTAGGVDIMGQDLKLKEFEVVSVREAAGSCPPSQR